MTANATVQIPATLDEAAVKSIVETINFVASARDAMSDEMVTRLAGTLSEGLALLDRVNRSGIARALPAIVQLVENGDLDRLISIGRVIAAVEDSLTDDTINRLSVVAAEMASLLDKLARSRLIDVLGREDVQNAIINAAEAASAANEAIAELPMPKGGLSGIWQLARDPGTQDALRFMALVSWKVRKQKSA
ncbi:MAG: hypothetical protein ACREUK_12775 [Burkholderiales bacterium]